MEEKVSFADKNFKVFKISQSLAKKKKKNYKIGKFWSSDQCSERWKKLIKPQKLTGKSSEWWEKNKKAKKMSKFL